MYLYHPALIAHVFNVRNVIIAESFVAQINKKARVKKVVNFLAGRCNKKFRVNLDVAQKSFIGLVSNF